MRLLKARISGYKNLKNFEIEFDSKSLATVIIGQNGTGKSNFIEALCEIFRTWDLNKDPPSFAYSLDYEIDNNMVSLSNESGAPQIIVNDAQLTRARFKEEQSKYFPDLVFGYYSGASRRLERLFDTHQQLYYHAIKRNENKSECEAALDARRLFYCRQIHGVMALFSFFAFPSTQVLKLLKEKLGISGFHSSLIHFREPWFAKGGLAAKVKNATKIWGAKGPAGLTARRLSDLAFHPFSFSGSVVDDYRDKQQQEAQIGAFFRGAAQLEKFAEPFTNDRELFYALEAMDISDLLREVIVWVTRPDGTSDAIAFSDLSDGERQLLMVLGLIRIARGKRCLFLLDEPDTHLNPHWQHTYLDLIQLWSERSGDEKNCHIVLTSHNPLTISALDREEVRVIYSAPDGHVRATPPYADPRGMGFTATLTEIFGLPTTLDSATQGLIDERNELARLSERTPEQDAALIKLNDQLAHLGFMFEDREPLYQSFLHGLKDVRYADRPPLTYEEIEARRQGMGQLIAELVMQEERD
jgi:predicted ATPase